MALELKPVPSKSVGIETASSGSIDASNNEAATNSNLRVNSSIECQQSTVNGHKTHSTKKSEEEQMQQKRNKLLHLFLFVSRGLVLFTLYFVFGILCLYSIGSLVSLKANNLFCPLYTEEEVRLYNFENDLPHGDPESCFYINRKKLNINDIKNLNLDIFTATVELNDTNIFQFVLYIILLLLLSLVTIYHSYLFIYDTIHVVCIKNKENARIKNILNRIKNKTIKGIATSVTHNSDSNEAYIQDKKLTCYQKLKLVKKKYLYIDSKWHLFKEAGKEIMELFIQIYALMLYGGLNIFDLNQNILAQESYIVRDFAIIISINCLLTGMIFLLYVLKHDIMHGHLFVSLLFAIDTMFEVFYCLFPLIYLTSNNNGIGTFSLNLRSLGTLKEQNFFIFLQSLFAISMLSIKCHSLLQELNPTNIIKKHWIQQSQQLRLPQIGNNKNKLNHNNNNIHYTPWITYTHNYNVKNNDSSSRFDINCDEPQTRSRDASIIEDTDMWYKVLTTRSQTSIILTQDIKRMFNRDGKNTNTDKTTEHVQKQKKLGTNAETALKADKKNGQLGSATERMFADILSVSAGEDSLVDSRKAETKKERNNKNLKVDHGHDVKTRKNSKHTQCHRKCIVGLFGTALILLGVFILVMFITFINNEFEPKCVHPYTVNNDWLTKHPELEIYTKYCKKQVINIFNYEYPCNCRLFGYDGDSDDNYNATANVEISQIGLERSFVKFTNLEGISIKFSDALSENSDNRYNLTKDMFNNLKYLKVLRLVHMNIYNIDESIKKLSKLEIFIMDYNNAEFYMPFDSISQIAQLKALELKFMPAMSNEEIPQSICDLKLVQYLELTFSYTLKTVPWDCIASNWENLAHIDATALIFVNYIDPNFWLLPSLSSALLDYADFNQSTFTFDTFIGYSNELSVVSLHGNTAICGNSNDDSKIFINGTEYNGFGYLNYSSSESFININNVNDTYVYNYNYDDMYPLLSFIEKFDPCHFVCSGGSSDLTCISSEWKDGVCDDLCNNQDCGWDGGDCVQSCDCIHNNTLLFNNECNQRCNTTECDFDLTACSQTVNINDTCTGDYFNYNISIANASLNYNNNSNSDNVFESTVCYTTWSTDLWCDSNCNVTECGYDNYECNSCPDNHEDSGCSRAYYILIEIGAGVTEPYELVSLNEICNFWDYFVVFGYVPDGVDNCTHYFYLSDTNANGHVGFYEAIVATAAAWGIDDQDKLAQIDCSLCMTDQSLYYF